MRFLLFSIDRAMQAMGSVAVGAYGLKA